MTYTETLWDIVYEVETKKKCPMKISPISFRFPVVGVNVFLKIGLISTHTRTKFKVGT